MTSLQNKIYQNARGKQYNVYSSSSTSDQLSLFDLKQNPRKKNEREDRNRPSFKDQIESRNRSRKPSNRKRRSRFRVSPVRGRSVSVSSTPSNASAKKIEAHEKTTENKNNAQDRRVKTRERRKHARQLAKAAFSDSQDNNYSNAHQPLQNQFLIESSHKSNGYDMRSSNGEDLLMKSRPEKSLKQKSSKYQNSRTKPLNKPSQLERIKKKKNILANSPRNSTDNPFNSRKNQSVDEFDFDASFPDDLQQIKQQPSDENFLHAQRINELQTNNFFDHDPFSKRSPMDEEKNTVQSTANTGGVLERRRRRHPSTNNNKSNGTSMRDDGLFSSTNSVISRDSNKSNLSSKRVYTKSTMNVGSQFFPQNDANTISSKTTSHSRQSTNSNQNHEIQNDRRNMRNPIKTIDIPREQPPFLSDALSTVSSSSNSFRFDAFGLEAEIDNEVSQWIEDIDTNDPEIQKLGMKASKDIAFFFEADFDTNSLFDPSPRNGSVKSGSSNRSHTMKKSFSKEKDGSLFSQPSKGTYSSSSTTEVESWAFKDDKFNNVSSQKSSSTRSYSQQSKPPLSIMKNSYQHNSFTSKATNSNPTPSDDFSFDASFPEENEKVAKSNYLEHEFSNDTNKVGISKIDVKRKQAYGKTKQWTPPRNYNKIPQTPLVRTELELKSNNLNTTPNPSLSRTQMIKKNNVETSKKSELVRKNVADEDLTATMRPARVKTDEDFHSQNEIERHRSFQSRKNEIYAQSEIDNNSPNVKITKLLNIEQVEKQNDHTLNHVANAKAHLSANFRKQKPRKVNIESRVEVGHTLKSSQVSNETRSPDYNKLWGKKEDSTEDNALVETRAFECMQQRSKLKSVTERSHAPRNQSNPLEASKLSEIEAVRNRMKQNSKKKNEKDENIKVSYEYGSKTDRTESEKGPTHLKLNIDEKSENPIFHTGKEIFRDSDSYYSKNSRTSTIKTSRTASTTRTESPIEHIESQPNILRRSQSASGFRQSRATTITERNSQLNRYETHSSVKEPFSSNQQVTLRERKKIEYTTESQSETESTFNEQEGNIVEISKLHASENIAHSNRWSTDSVRSENSYISNYSNERKQLDNNIEISSSQEVDVASLIRRRIAKSKEKIPLSPQRIQNTPKAPDYNAARNNLRKIRITRPPPPPPTEISEECREKKEQATEPAYVAGDEKQTQSMQPLPSTVLPHKGEKYNLNEDNTDQSQETKPSAEPDSETIEEKHHMTSEKERPAKVTSEKETPKKLISDAGKSKLTALFAARSLQIPNPQSNTKEAKDKKINPFSAAASVLSQIKNLKNKNEKCEKVDSTDNSVTATSKKETIDILPVNKTGLDSTDGRPALKNDPKYEKYFKMLKVGLPMPVVQHAMIRDGLDPEVMNGDHLKPAGLEEGIPLKQDPKYAKYFKMLKIGMPIETVKHAMQRDGLDPSVMDGDHNAPASAKGAPVSSTSGTTKKVLPKDTHRRTRLHWNTLNQVRQNSVWALVNQDSELDDINIDENEFNQLFQAELKPTKQNQASTTGDKSKKKSVVKVIEPKRATNGGIILARIRASYDNMAKAIDMMDDRVMDQHQLTGILEYLPSPTEKKLLKTFLSEAADRDENIDDLCECEKFMVAMLRVKHSKRKVRALIFKQQFMSCIDEVLNDANLIGKACDQLSKSVRLRKLLGIVLNVGNRLNTAGPTKKGKAGAFTLESLLKLNQAKAFDKKTTFLHYIIVIVKRNDKQLLTFKDDLSAVFQGDKIYWDQCVLDLEEAEDQLENLRMVALKKAREMRPEWVNKRRNCKLSDECSISDESLSLEEEVSMLRSTDIGCFTLDAIKKISVLREKVEKTQRTYAKLLEYFGEDEKGGMQPHELFEIIVTFSRNFDSSLKEVEMTEKAKSRAEKKKAQEEETSSSSNVSHPASKKHVPRTKTQNVGRIRASSMQPNMSNVINDIKAYAKGLQIRSDKSKSSSGQEEVMVASKEQTLPKSKASPISATSAEMLSSNICRKKENETSSDVESRVDKSAPYPHSFAPNNTPGQKLTTQDVHPSQSNRHSPEDVVTKDDTGKPPIKSRDYPRANEILPRNQLSSNNEPEQPLNNPNKSISESDAINPTRSSSISESGQNDPVEMQDFNIKESRLKSNSDASSLRETEAKTLSSKIIERRSDRMRRSLSSKSRYTVSNEPIKSELSNDIVSAKSLSSNKSSHIIDGKQSTSKDNDSQKSTAISKTTSRRSERMRRSLRSRSPYTVVNQSSIYNPESKGLPSRTPEHKKDQEVRSVRPRSPSTVSAPEKYLESAIVSPTPIKAQSKTPERRALRMRRSMRSKSPYTSNASMEKKIDSSIPKTNGLSSNTREIQSEGMPPRRQPLQEGPISSRRVNNHENSSQSASPIVQKQEVKEERRKERQPAMSRTSRFRNAAAAQRKQRSMSSKRSNSIGRDYDQERVEWPVSSSRNSLAAIDSQLDVD